jgi:hypothetical protein
MTILRAAVSILAILELTSNAHASSLKLGESKDRLKLDYTVSVTVHQTGRVTVVFSLKDEGRHKPLPPVDLGIPSDDGTGCYHLATSQESRDENSQKIARIHIHRDWLKNAKIDLKTAHLDGKMSLRT